ncbi:MAG TPA: tRNA (adenosine(37)-N6)-threonylcarbamoyltransferase complex dimerization subunit type 1 TsaB [Anaerolineae bacterium]
MLLALDTSTRQAGIALYDGGRGLVAEYNWYSGHQHTVELMPEIAHLLVQAGETAAGLSAVAVALGPGSFTGVRVALAAAKGLALARDLPLLGVPTLDVLAYPHQAETRPVIALLQAGRGRVCWAPYGHGTQGWGSQAPFALATVAGLAANLAGPAVFAGELSPGDRQMLAEQWGDRVSLLPPALALRRAGYLAEMAWTRLAAGERADPANLNPIYLQEPVTFPTRPGTAAGS